MRAEPFKDTASSLPAASAAASQCSSKFRSPTRPLSLYRDHASTYTVIRGTQSIEPCTRLLNSAGEPQLSRSAIQWLGLLARPSGRTLRRLGQPTKAVRYLARRTVAVQGDSCV
jgi:hypothetical protein